jgi:hypothetical protein
MVRGFFPDRPRRRQSRDHAASASFVNATRRHWAHITPRGARILLPRTVESDRDPFALSARRNVWPNSKIEATKCVVPFGALVTPRKHLPDMPVVPYDPVRCKGCAACLNPYARVDFNGKLWICPFCYTRNHFPAHYASISETNLPAELFPTYTTIEYTLQRPKAPPPAYLFVVDVCLVEDELAALRQSLAQALSLLPEDALVGLITYGTHVHVHELGFAECQKTYVFRGGKEFTQAQIADQLFRGTGGFRGGAAAARHAHPARNDASGASHASVASKFLAPLSEIEFSLSAILENLQRDSFSALPECRPARCTGTAVACAATVLSSARPAAAARALLFVGGPATEGGGAVVGKDLEQAMRSHKDIAKDAAPFMRKAAKFYESVATQLCVNGHSLDVFACSLDQVGLAEMKVCAEKTGGMVVLAESFANTVFKTSFTRMFSVEGEDALGVSSGGVFEVITSRDVRTAGMRGAVRGAGQEDLTRRRRRRRDRRGRHDRLEAVLDVHRHLAGRVLRGGERGGEGGQRGDRPALAAAATVFPAVRDDGDDAGGRNALEGHDDDASLDGRRQRERRRRGFRPGSGRDVSRQATHLEDGDGRRVRLPGGDAVVGPIAHPAVPALRRLPQRTTRRRSSSCRSSASTRSSCSTCAARSSCRCSTTPPMKPRTTV